MAAQTQMDGTQHEAWLVAAGYNREQDVGQSNKRMKAPVNAQ